MTNKTINFYHDKPLFGFDIGYGSLKVMQLGIHEDKAAAAGKPHKVIGYGDTHFGHSAIKDGVIVEPEIIAKAAKELFDHHLIGDITTQRVAMAIPSHRTFIRSLRLPKLSEAELKNAIQLEAEQYISLPLDKIYLDYTVTHQTADSMELLLIAVPKQITDSYLQLSSMLGLEAILIEPTLNSTARLFKHDDQNDVVSFIIDFGSMSSDISVFDKNILVTGTVQGGGENFTEAITKALRVSPHEATLIKTRYGLGASKKQAAIRTALEPTLEQITKEIRRMIRYYEERYGTERPISQIVTLGGGANMPGLSEYLTDSLRLAVRHTDPWHHLTCDHIKPPSSADRAKYATVVGLALTGPREVFAA